MIEDIKKIQNQLREVLNYGFAADLCFIGNTSEHYPWTPGKIVDIDAFLFVESVNIKVANWLNELSQTLVERYFEKANFELRIVEGPYKPDLPSSGKSAYLLHMGVFTDESYMEQCQLKRWGWRKYKCIREPNRLERLGPNSLDLRTFIDAKKGLRFRLNQIKAGTVWFDELTLPSLKSVRWSVIAGERLFNECCFSYTLGSARNHARALGLGEADSLPNETFFTWYDQNVRASPELLELLQLKNMCRQQGYHVEPEYTRKLSIAFLEGLYEECTIS